MTYPTFSNGFEDIELEDIHDHEGQDEFYMIVDGQIKLALSFSEMVQLAEMSEVDFEIGFEYFMQVWNSFDAWQTAEENFVCHNNLDAIKDMIRSNLFDFPDFIMEYIDFQGYWDHELRHSHTTTDNYVFSS